MIKRLNWTHKGMGAIGDAHGPIHVYSARYEGQEIVKLQPTRGAAKYFTDGACYRTQSAAVAAINRKETSNG